MAVHCRTGYLITSLRSYDYSVLQQHRSEKSILAGSRLADLLDRLPIKEGGNDLGARWDTVCGSFIVNNTVCGSAGLNTGVRVRDCNHSLGRAVVGKVCIQALGAGDDVVASNKKIVAEAERTIRTRTLCEARLRRC